MVGNKQGTNQLINQIKKDGGYYDMEYTSSVYPILDPTSSVNNDTMGTVRELNQMEHKAEEEKGDIDFMHKWIQEKRGKRS